jgi:tetratricopeptide (TPR) repeat protein
MPTVSRIIRHVRSKTFAALLGCVCAAGAAGVRADTVWTLSSAANAKPFERPKVKIDGLAGDALLFRSAQTSRQSDPKPLNEVWRIEVDNEPALNAAEAAFVAGKWDDAIQNYQRAVTTSRADWVKQYATIRLATAADKSGKFSAAATAYAALVGRDPKAAANVKPRIPDGKVELPAAISAVKTALSDAKLKPEQRTTLQAFLAELYIANGQLKEAEALGAKVAASPPPAAPAGTASRGAAAPAANKAQIDLKLQLAVAALQQKKYQDAIDAIDSVAAGVTDPAQQAEALFCTAQAREGLAGDDPAKLKDAALGYMRVVAHFRTQPQAPRVAESLLRTGAVLERAKLLPDALAAYQAVQTDYKDSPLSKEAAAAAARVQKAIEGAKG